MKILNEYVKNKTAGKALLTGKLLQNTFALYEQYLTPAFQVLISTLENGIFEANNMKSNELLGFTIVIIIFIVLVALPIVFTLHQKIREEITITQKLILLTPFYLLSGSEKFHKVYKKIL